LAEARGDVLDAELLRVQVRLQAARQPVLLARRELLQADLEALVLVAAGRLAGALDDRPLLRDVRADARERDGLRRRERDLNAAAEVDAEVEALAEDGAEADRDRDHREREPEPAAAGDVDALPARDLACRRAHEAGVREPREAAEQTEQRARRRHR